MSAFLSRLVCLSPNPLCFCEVVLYSLARRCHILSQNSQDDTFKKSADLGGILAQIVLGAIEGYTSANNVLMHGQNYDGTGDLRAYFKGGMFVAFPGIDKNNVTNTVNQFLIGQAVNQLYRVQKIFIMGGGACGDNQGIGSGPQDSMVCRDGKAWYLYYWYVLAIYLATTSSYALLSI